MRVTIPGQIGLERSLSEYFASLTVVFEEVRRVLLPDGAAVEHRRLVHRGLHGEHLTRRTRCELRRSASDAGGPKPKDLIGAMAEAFALQRQLVLAGGHRRNKPNCQPESGKIG